MQFHSIAFLVFLPIVWASYHSIRTPHARACLLLAASYVFYMWWRVDYTILLVASTLTDYTCGRVMGEKDGGGGSKRRRLIALLASLSVNLCILIGFKYWNFFASFGSSLASVVHPGLELPALDFILPLGISFYTFQTMGYSIDVYRGRVAPERNLVNFALYVSFFPQLVAGPIERSSRLIPQIREARKADSSDIVCGLRLMLWGMFKKLAVADTLSIFVDTVYANPQAYNGAQLMLGTAFFAMQIYCDFSGYTDIAIGCARTLGFDLMKNFRRPYLAWSPTEFWRRWHISLSSWFRDYVYIPMGGSRCGLWRGCFSLLVTFAISGLWHGANWTFVVWGVVHGALVLVERLIRRVDPRPSGVPAMGSRLLGTVVTLGLVSFAWIFFRAESMTDAWYVVTNLFTGWTMQGISCGLYQDYLLKCLMLAAIVIGFELWEEWRETASEDSIWDRMPRAVRWGGYWSVSVLILLFGQLGGLNQFIYFQF